MDLQSPQPNDNILEKKQKPLIPNSAEELKIDAADNRFETQEIVEYIGTTQDEDSDDSERPNYMLSMNSKMEGDHENRQQMKK